MKPQIRVVLFNAIEALTITINLIVTPDYRVNGKNIA